jgi:hypothetical protein
MCRRVRVSVDIDCRYGIHELGRRHLEVVANGTCLWAGFAGPEDGFCRADAEKGIHCIVVEALE